MSEFSLEKFRAQIDGYTQYASAPLDDPGNPSQVPGATPPIRQPGEILDEARKPFNVGDFFRDVMPGRVTVEPDGTMVGGPGAVDKAKQKIADFFAAAGLYLIGGLLILLGLYVLVVRGDANVRSN